MANPENIIPHRISSASEAREKGRAGGLRSGVARREKASLREAARLMLSMDTASPDAQRVLERMGLDPDERTNAAMVTATMIAKAAQGDVKAYEALSRNMGALDDAEGLRSDEDGSGGHPTPFRRDFALLIGKDFLRPHRLMAAEGQLEFWTMGGRGSLKSSWASLELVNHVETHPGEHAAALMKRKNALRDAVYAQVVWAIHTLGLEDDYDMPVSTLRIKKKSTGQLILFAGCDDPHKSKGLKPPFGHIGFAWFEEVDQFRGMSDIRTVMQSVARGGDRTVRVYTYNPPRTRDNWANKEISSSPTRRPCARRTSRRTSTSTWESPWASAGRCSTAWRSAR